MSSVGHVKKTFGIYTNCFDNYTIRRMIALHKERSPFNHNEPLIRANFTDFSRANDDLDPKCLRGKYWELIRYDTYKKITTEYKWTPLLLNRSHFSL